MNGAAKVQGYCPMGCGETLMLAAEGYVTCGHLDCPRPEAPHEILAVAETEHVVTFHDDDFGILHPLRERIGLVEARGLKECELLHRYLHSRSGPPIQLGRYRAIKTARSWDFVRMPS